jgi:hypothetical protein
MENPSMRGPLENSANRAAALAQKFEAARKGRKKLRNSLPCKASGISLHEAELLPLQFRSILAAKISRESFMRTLLLLLAALATPAFAEELQYTVTAEAQPINGNPYIGPPLPAAFSFDVNTLTGTQRYEFNNGVLDQFSATNLLFTHITASVGGQQLVNSPSALGFIGGDTGIFPPQLNLYDIATNAAPGLVFETVVFQLTTPLSPGTQDPLGFMLTHSQLGANIGAINDQWGVDQFTIKVAEVNVPEPGTLLLMALALGVLGLLRYSRPQSSGATRVTS